VGPASAAAGRMARASTARPAGTSGRRRITGYKPHGTRIVADTRTPADDLAQSRDTVPGAVTAISDESLDLRWYAYEEVASVADESVVRLVDRTRALL